MPPFVPYRIVFKICRLYFARKLPGYAESAPQAGAPGIVTVVPEGVTVVLAFVWVRPRRSQPTG